VILDGIKTFYFIRRGLASSYWPSSRLRRLQEQHLRKLLLHAYREIPIYRELYDRAAFKPETFRSLDDLERVPLLRKSELKAAKPHQVVARGIDPSRCASVATSGSTGVPLRIYLGRHEQCWQRAAAWRILFEHGFRWTDRSLEIRQNLGDTFFIQKIGIAPKEWISILEPSERWAERLITTKPQVLIAGAGTLHALAEAIEKMNAVPPRLRLIISDSETLNPTTRSLVERVLGTNPIDIYGLVELSNFAWECERRQGFHVSADSHLVEVVAPIGEPGPVIVTDLGMRTMPMIRYDTGDMAEMSARPCPCGRTLPLLARVYGRAVDSIVLPHGRKLFWPFFHEILGHYDQLQGWQVRQEDVRGLTLQLVSPAAPPDLLRKIEADLRQALPHEVELRIQKVDAIKTKAGEKTRMIVSNISRLEQGEIV
jgi:phenylacetate-CoA ligase